MDQAQHTGLTRRQFAAMADVAVLAPNASWDQIKRLCTEAKRVGFGHVCFAGCWAGDVVDELQGSAVLPCGVVGFPHGNGRTTGKALEASELVTLGILEVDMVMNQGWLVSGRYGDVEADIVAVVEAAQQEAPDAIVKVILETANMPNPQAISMACHIAVRAGASFVKTSSGFASRGASIEDIMLMRVAVGGSFDIKASGGIRTAEQAANLVVAGATRLGVGLDAALAIYEALPEA